MGEMRDTLQTLTGETLLPTYLNSAGVSVFVGNAETSQRELAQIVDFYRSVHAISYGSSIPNTGTSITHVIGDVLTEEEVGVPALQESWVLSSISATNTGLAPVTVELRLEGACFAVALCNPNEQTPITNIPSWPIVKGQSLQAYQRDGSSGEITIRVSYCKASL